MKILIISASFYPMQSPRSFRTTELVKELCRKGHDVTLATYYDKEHHNELAEEFKFKIIDFGEKYFKPIDITGNGIFNLLKRGVRRYLVKYAEYPKIDSYFKVKKVLQNVKDFDLMISIATPHPVHWGTAAGWNEQHPQAKCWIADCGDPYMLVPYDKIGKAWYFKSFEKNWCRKADFITIPNINMAVNFYPEFKHKFHQITQGFKFEESQQFLKPYVKNRVPTFVFSGNFIPNIRDPKELLEFLVNYEADFKFHIYTRKRNLIQKYVDLSKGRIIVHDYIPRPELLGVLSQADFLVNIGYDPKSQIPSKLIDYYITGRPILNLLSENFDKELVANFLEGDYSNKFTNPDIYQYRIENVAKQFLDLYLKKETLLNEIHH